MSDIRDVLVSQVFGDSTQQPFHPQTCSHEVVIDSETDERLKPRLASMTTQLERLESGMVYKGTVTTYYELPEEAEYGDTYKCEHGNGEDVNDGDMFVFDGENWQKLSGEYDFTDMEQQITIAVNTANNAAEAAGEAKETADQAIDIANEALAQSGKAYYIVIEGEDLNEYSDSGRYHAIDCTNAPSEAEFGYFVDVDINSDSNMVRQRAVLVDFSIPAMDGTVWFRGNLAGDLTVNGNVQVDGEISGNVTASGSITYGSCTGTVTENASLTSYDIGESGHGTTIYGDAEVVDGVFHTYYRFDTQATLEMNIPCVIDSPEYCVYTDTDLRINKDMTCTGTSGSSIIQNMTGTVTVAEGVTLTLINNGTGYGLRQRSGELVVNGEMYVTSANDGIYITHDGTVSGTGKIYVNGDLYYNGGAE